jgi:hypothetical protein
MRAGGAGFHGTHKENASGKEWGNMFGLESVSVAMSYILSVLCTVFCVGYGVVKAMKKEQ